MLEIEVISTFRNKKIYSNLNFQDQPLKIKLPGCKLGCVYPFRSNPTFDL